MIGAVDRAIALGPVDFEQGTAGVARMQLQALIAADRQRRRHPHADRVDMRAPAAKIVGIGDHHIAAIALAAIQIAFGRGAGLCGGHHLDERGADRQQGVVQPEHADIGVVMTDLDIEDGDQIRDHGVKLAGDQTELPEPMKHCFNPPWGPLFYRVPVL